MPQLWEGEEGFLNIVVQLSIINLPIPLFFKEGVLAKAKPEPSPFAKWGKRGIFKLSKDLKTSEFLCENSRAER